MNNSHFKKFQSNKGALGKAMHNAKKKLMPTDRRAPVPVSKPKPKPPSPDQQSLF